MMAMIGKTISCFGPLKPSTRKVQDFSDELMGNIEDFIVCLSPAWWLLRSGQTRSHPELGRQTLQRQWYFVSRHGRVGRRQACQRQTAKPPHKQNQRNSGLPQAAVRASNKTPKLTAGWSSPVARQAHNLKVAGSNPAPATTDNRRPAIARSGAFSFCAAPVQAERIAARSPRNSSRRLQRTAASAWLHLRDAVPLRYQLGSILKPEYFKERRVTCALALKL